MNRETTREILRKVRQVEIRTNRLADHALAGQYHSVFKGRGMDFDRVREYSPGDEVRTIDWNVTARTGKLFVKRFTEERELTILLAVDVSASGFFGSTAQSKREYTAEVASVLAFSARRNNDKVGLVLFTGAVEHYVPPAKGRGHILRVIRDILFYQPKGRGTDAGAALDFTNRVLRRRAVVFLLSDFCLPDGPEALRPRLAVTNKRHDLVAVAVNDPRESNLPDVGWITLEDAETGEMVDLDTSRSSVREAYARAAKEARRGLRRTLSRAGVDLMELDTSRPYLPVLLGFFKNRERRRH